MDERKFRYNPERVGQIVTVCAILHNICVEGRLEINHDMPPDNFHNQPNQVVQINEGNISRQNLTYK